MDTALSSFALGSPHAAPSGSPRFSPKLEALASPKNSPSFPAASPFTNLDNLLPLASPDFLGLSSTPNLSSHAGRKRASSFLGDLSLTPSFPRRSPRLHSLSTPTFHHVASPSMSGMFKHPSLDLRRSPRIATRQTGLDLCFSPSTFLHSPSMHPNIKPPPMLPSPRAASISSKVYNSATNLSSALKSSTDDPDPPPGNMSILNKLQQSNKRRRRDSEDLVNKLKSASASGAMLAPYTPPNKPTAPSTAISSMPQMQQLPKPLISVMSCPKSTGNGSGSSCHQCKSRRSMNNLIFCCNMFTKRSAKDKKKIPKEKRNVCRKKYCDQCLLKFYHEKPPVQRQDPSSNWPCPACRGMCCCAACRRQKVKTTTGNSDPLTMSPATSLACGLVYFKDMLKFKLGDPASSNGTSILSQPVASSASISEMDSSSSLSTAASSSASTIVIKSVSVFSPPSECPIAVPSSRSILSSSK